MNTPSIVILSSRSPSQLEREHFITGLAMTRSTATGRHEDGRFITGNGRYTSDIRADALHAVFVRSPHASAKILGVDGSGAKDVEGVVAVLTASDLESDGVAAYSAPLKIEGPDGALYKETPRPLLVGDRIRFLGEPVAMVIATSREAAMDGAEAVGLDIEPLPAIVEIDAARRPDALLLWDERPGNLAFHWRKGEWKKVGEALSSAHHVARIKTPVTRVMASPMEPRNALAVPGTGGHTTLYASHQNPQALREALAAMFAIERDAIRVVSPDVGGAFGMKAGALREECLVFWAAGRLGRAVRWTADRSETFLSDEAGRDVEIEVELGLDEKGRFTALRASLRANIGAYASGRSMVPIMNIGGIAGVYRTPLIAGEALGYFSNTLPTAPYRGAGRPEATFAIERVIDVAAREMGIDPFELRRRNLIAKDDMPYRTPFIFTYDSGDFAHNMRVAAERADYAGFAERRRQSEKQGRLRGIGISNPIEVAGGPFANPGTDFGDVHVHPDGSVTLYSGVLSAGEGLETAMIGLASEALGVAPEKFRYVQGDTDSVPRGKGMGGSAGLTTGGSAMTIALDRLLALGKEIASEEMEAAVEDIVYEDGAFCIAGTDRSLSLADVAGILEHRDGGRKFAAAGEFKPGSATYPNGCHICEVEIDPETGKCEIVAYTGVEDIGPVLFGQMAEGQIHGGVAQGLGQALCEIVRTDADGQVLSASFMDYAMPRADDFPFYDADFTETPTLLNPLGVKGVGEAGAVGALSAGTNAICDALASAEVTSFDMPATPLRVWTALAAVGRKDG